MIEPPPVGASVAPAKLHKDLQFRGELEAFEVSATAERLARLEGDVELLDRLMWREYTGPEWAYFQRVLIEYAYPIIKAWVISGAIVEQLRRKRLKGVSTLHKIARDSEHAHDLAVETTVAAVRNFREKVLIPGIWNPSKGASLKTFFVGRCLIDFPNQYTVWRRRQFREISNVYGEKEPPEIEYHPERRLLNDEAVDAIVRDASEALRRILTLRAMGWTCPEIGEALGMTTKAVEHQVLRYREKANDQRKNQGGGCAIVVRKRRRAPSSRTNPS